MIQDLIVASIFTIILTAIVCFTAIGIYSACYNSDAEKTGYVRLCLKLHPALDKIDCKAAYNNDVKLKV